MRCATLPPHRSKTIERPPAKSIAAAGVVSRQAAGSVFATFGRLATLAVHSVATADATRSTHEFDSSARRLWTAAEPALTAPNGASNPTRTAQLTLVSVL